MKLDSTQIKDFKKNGYLIIKNFFDSSVLDDILFQSKYLFGKQIERVLQEKPELEDINAFDDQMFRLFEKDFPTIVHTGKQIQNIFTLHELGVNEKLIGLLKELGLEEPNIAVKPAIQFNSRYLSKGGTHWKLGAHQDWRTGQGSLDSLVLWFPLIECKKELGALQVVPGSHKNGLYPAEGNGYEGYIDPSFDFNFIQTEFEKGDLLIFSAFLVHQSGENITKNIRWSIQFRYNNMAEESFIQRGFPMPYNYKPEVALISKDFPKKEDLQRIFE